MRAVPRKLTLLAEGVGVTVVVLKISTRIPTV